MRIGMQRKVDKLGRVTIPKEYRDFYKLNCQEEIYVIDTPEGVLITNPLYKVIRVEKTAEN